MTEEQNLPEQSFNNPIQDFQPIQYKPRISYLGQFGILLGFFGTGLIIGTFIFMIIWKMMTGASIFNIERDLGNLQYASAAKIAQLVSSVFMFFVPVFLYATIVNRKPLQHLGFRKLVTAKQILLIIVIAAVGFLLSIALSEVTQLIPISKNLTATFQKWDDNYNQQVVAMATMKNPGDYFFTLAVIALVPAIVEESLFRGGLQQLLEKWSRDIWVALIITSILFSAIHGSYYGFLSRVALGIILGLLFYYSRNIWLNILMHFLNNAIAVTQLYVVTRTGKLTKETMDDNLHIGYPAIAMTLVLVLILYALFKAFKKESVRIGADKIDNTFSPDDNPFI